MSYAEGGAIREEPHDHIGLVLEQMSGCIVPAVMTPRHAGLLSQINQQDGDAR